MTIKHILLSLAVATAALPATANAAYLIEFEQVGSDVVATGSGWINTAALTFFTTGSESSSVEGAIGGATVGGFGRPTTYFTDFTEPRDFTGPTAIGAGSRTFADSSTGVSVGIRGRNLILLVPTDYLSASPLGTSTSTYRNATINGLGLTPGAYVWTWGSGTTMDTFTIEVFTPIPEPATWAMLTFGFGAVGASLRRRRREQGGRSVA